MTGGKHIKTLMFAVVVLVGMIAGRVSAQNDISVEVALSRDTIGMDEQVLLTITASGAVQDLPAPQMPSLATFEVYSRGQSSSFSMINGRMSFEQTYRYILLPKKAGTFPISNVSIVYQNKRYKANDVTLTVLAEDAASSDDADRMARDRSGRRRDHFLVAEVDRDNPYVNQQVTLTLKFYIAVRHSTPELTWPTSTGFWRESLSSSTAYNQRVDGRTYKVYEIKSALFPTQAGQLEIGRALITSSTSTGIFAFGGEQITARSRPITINVKPLPKTGRPVDFTGTVGKFSITARADKTTVDVNQPVTLTVRITGTGHIKSVGEPVIPELDAFRVYRASSKENVTKAKNQLGGTKIFEEVFVPRQPGPLEIPALTFSYFNPQTGRYHTEKTRPVALEVRQVDGYAEGSDAAYVPSGVTIGSQAQDIRYIRENIGQLQPIGALVIARPLYLVVNGVPVVVLAVLVAFRLRREKLSKDVGYARSRAAGRLARKRLARARSLAKLDSAGEFYAEIAQAVTSFVADKLNISPHGLTSDAIAELLRQRGAADGLITATVSVLQKSDFHRFAPATVTDSDMAASLTAAEDVMTQLGRVKFD